MKKNSPGCSCCGPSCTCPLGCCDGDPPITMDEIVSGFPSYVMRDGVYIIPFTANARRMKLEISGLDGMNGTRADQLVMGPFGADDCRLYTKAHSFDVTITIAYNDVAAFPHTCATALTTTESITITFGYNAGLFVFGWAFNILSQTGTFSTLAQSIYDAFIGTYLNNLNYGGTVQLCNGASAAGYSETWMSTTGTTCDSSGATSGTITTEYAPNYGTAKTIKAVGIRYTISDLPTEFFSRVGSLTTVFGVSGLDAFNGTYEVDFDDPDLCTGGDYEEEIEVTVQEYEVSISEPCTSIEVGYPFTGTATLKLPPTNEDFFVWVIRIEHPYLTGTRIDYIELDFEWPEGIHCDGHSDSWHEGDECVTNSDPVITVEAEPYFI